MTQAPGRNGGLLRSSAVMAAGTLASRLTGFLRTAALVAAMGTQGLGDAHPGTPRPRSPAVIMRWFPP